MKKNFFIFTLLFSLNSFSIAYAGQDILEPTKLTLNSADAEAALQALARAPGSALRKYRPILPSGFQIVSPLRVNGSDEQPNLTMSLQKCVGFFCQQVKMVGEVRMKEVIPTQGACAKQYLLKMDLSQSDRALSDAYDALNVAICYKKGPNGKDTLSFNTAAHLGANADFKTAALKPIILDFLRQQIQPITQAVQTTLQAYQAKQPRKNQALIEEKEEETSSTPAA